MKKYYYIILIPAFIPFIPYLLPFIPNQIFGFQLTGFSWIFSLLITLVFLFTTEKKSTFPVFFWLPWIFYLIGYLIIDFSFNGLQLTLQYILFILIGILFSKFDYSAYDLIILFKKSIPLIMFIFISSIITKILLDRWTLYTANYVMILTIAAAITITSYFETKKIKFLFFYLLLLIAPIYENTRMALLVFFLLIPLNFASINFARRITFIAILSVLSLFVFYSPKFQQKTFFNGKGEITDLVFSNKNLNSNGRTHWAILLEKGLKENPLFGNGPRSDLDVLLIDQKEIKEVHNDYLSVRFNYGWIGLFTLLIGLVGQTISIYKLKFEIATLEDKILWSSIMLLIISLLIFMLSDNILKYTIFFPNILFVMIGILYSRLKGTV